MCKGPKIVVWDIEILANLNNVMANLTRFWNNAGLNANISTVISFGYKIHGEKKAHCINAWDFKKRWTKDVNDDYEVVKAAYNILKDADAIVTHYGSKFDLPFLNARLIHHGFPPIPPMQHIDTWRVARYKLKLSSNRLDEVAKFLKTERKMENGGWQLWVDVLARKKKACRMMSEYCKQDVECLDQVFAKLLPIVPNAPNRNLWADRKVCPRCGSSKIHKRGVRSTNANQHQRYQCKDCGGWMTGKRSKKNANLRGL